MSEKMIARTIPTTTIQTIKVELSGENVTGKKQRPLIIHGEAIKDKEEAEKLVKKEFGANDQYIISKIEVDYAVYEIPLSVFLSNAIVNMEKTKKAKDALLKGEPLN